MLGGTRYVTRLRLQGKTHVLAFPALNCALCGSTWFWKKKIEESNWLKIERKVLHCQTNHNPEKMCFTSPIFFQNPTQFTWSYSGGWTDREVKSTWKNDTVAGLWEWMHFTEVYHCQSCHYALLTFYLKLSIFGTVLRRWVGPTSPLDDLRVLGSALRSYHLWASRLPHSCNR